LHQQLDQASPQQANAKIIRVALAAPHPLQWETKDKDGEHVKEQVVKTAVQKSVSEQLPGLKVATVQGPQCQLRGDVLQQINCSSDNDYADRYRRSTGESQAGFLVQKHSPLILRYKVDSTPNGSLVYNITMTEHNIHDSHQPPQDFHKFPAARGLAWVTGSWGLVKRQPLRLLLISLLLQFLLSFSQASVLGLLVILALPVLSAGMLHAFYTVEQGEKPLLTVLFLPFRSKKLLSALLLLGAVVMVLGFLAITLIMSGQLMNVDTDLLSRIEQGDLDAVQLIDPQIMENAVITMAIGAAISGTITYFAVPLIWFKKQGLGSAIRVGLVALARNWRPGHCWSSGCCSACWRFRSVC